MMKNFDIIFFFYNVVFIKKSINPVGNFYTWIIFFIVISINKDSDESFIFIDRGSEEEKKKINRWYIYFVGSTRVVSSFFIIHD
jgi:hypothetical protein